VRSVIHKEEELDTTFKEQNDFAVTTETKKNFKELKKLIIIAPLTAK
jgi:hypothetical protein